MACFFFPFTGQTKSQHSWPIGIVQITTLRFLQQSTFDYPPLISQIGRLLLPFLGPDNQHFMLVAHFACFVLLLSTQSRQFSSTTTLDILSGSCLPLCCRHDTGARTAKTVAFANDFVYIVKYFWNWLVISCKLQILPFPATINQKAGCVLFWLLLSKVFVLHTNNFGNITEVVGSRCFSNLKAMNPPERQWSIHICLPRRKIQQGVPTIILVWVFIASNELVLFLQQSVEALVGRNSSANTHQSGRINFFRHPNLETHKASTWSCIALSAKLSILEGKSRTAHIMYSVIGTRQQWANPWRRSEYWE